MDNSYGYRVTTTKSGKFKIILKSEMFLCRSSRFTDFTGDVQAHVLYKFRR